jgi:hypothetical protein
LLDKVLIVACNDASQESAFAIMEDLRISGYGADLCRAAIDGTKIKCDRLLTETTELVDYKGLIFLDFGGDPKAAVGLAKRADAGMIMVAGYGKGCLVLVKAKLLKDKYVCLGLPKEAYKGAKMVKSKAVRSDNIVTCAGNCPSAFSALVLDCLGGGVKKIVKSWSEKDMVNSEEVDGIISDPIKVAELVEPVCGPMAKDVVADHYIKMTRTASGWEPTDAVSVSGELTPREIRQAEMACVAIQSGLANPSGANQFEVGISGGRVAQLAAPPSGAVVGNEFTKKQEHKLLVEREMAQEGIFIQPDGRLAIRNAGGTQVYSPQQALGVLQQEVVEAAASQLDVSNADLDENERARKVSSRAKHRLKLVEDFAEVPKSQKHDFGKIAGIYPSTVQGPYSNIDLPMSERVWRYEDGQDELDDDDSKIRDQERYNPETDEDGFYYVWSDPSLEPTSWQQVEQGDTPYKIRKMRP